MRTHSIWIGYTLWLVLGMFGVHRFYYGRVLLLLGVFGTHRFYLGNTRGGLLYALTLGVLGLGVLYDLGRLDELVSEANEAWLAAPRSSALRASLA